jgi:hypothetical protein
MGLLDDAIREHLDLKRRRGADPAEIERAEHEALGPVRRGPESASASEEPGAYDLEAEPEWDESYDDEAEDAPEADARRGAEPAVPPLQFDSVDEPTRLHEPPQPPEPEPLESEPPEPRQSARPGGAAGSGRSDFEDPFDDDPFAEEAFPERPASPTPHPAPGGAGDEVGGETVEYHVEEAFGEPPEGDAHQQRQPRREGEGEDVLEETPEFLQDTPDHDRLWFEQRPPRDFDFDG